ncbi:DUF4148 domain-containing protein [Paraburkholderia sediminicola]|uniref:DUF4148 domain-containing protein n=1 Tax=Paraburkholderia sediminicola TaxID=458836 RepID=UPI0038B6C295
MTSKRIVLATLLASALSTSALAYNDDRISAPDDPNRIAPPWSKNVPTTQPRQIGKTRAQVREELIEAQRAGIIPTTEADYPPSQRTINANRARYQISERYWASKD